MVSTQKKATDITSVVTQLAKLKKLSDFASIDTNVVLSLLIESNCPTKDKFLNILPNLHQSIRSFISIWANSNETVDDTYKTLGLIIIVSIKYLNVNIVKYPDLAHDHYQELILSLSLTTRQLNKVTTIEDTHILSFYESSFKSIDSMCSKKNDLNISDCYTLLLQTFAKYAIGFRTESVRTKLHLGSLLDCLGLAFEGPQFQYFISNYERIKNIAATSVFQSSQSNDSPVVKLLSYCLDAVMSLCTSSAVMNSQSASHLRVVLFQNYRKYGIDIIRALDMVRCYISYQIIGSFLNYYFVHVEYVVVKQCRWEAAGEEPNRSSQRHLESTMRVHSCYGD